MSKYVLLFVSLMLSSCATIDPVALANPNGVSNLAWPAPPETPRIKYLTSFSTPEDLNMDKTFIQRFVDLIIGSEFEGFLRPYAVAVHDQSIVVADPDSSAVHTFDLNKRIYSRINHAGKHQFETPIGVAIDEKNLAISDSQLNKVFILDRNYQLLHVLDDFKRPTGLALDEALQRLYVVDTTAHQIHVYRTNGDLLYKMGERGEAVKQFNFPSHLTFSQNLLVINDTMNFRIQSYDSNGNYLFTFGKQGDASGYFTQSKGVAIDSDGHVYIADALANRIQIFDKNGDFLLEFGNTGDGPGEFRMPSGLAISEDKVFVADSYNQRIQVFKYLKSEK